MPGQKKWKSPTAAYLEEIEGHLVRGELRDQEGDAEDDQQFGVEEAEHDERGCPGMRRKISENLRQSKETRNLAIYSFPRRKKRAKQ